MTLNSLLKEAKPLSLDNAVDDFGCFRDYPAAIKQTKTGQYIICNGTLANRDGIALEDYIGLTVYDVGKITNRKKRVTTNAIEADQRLMTQQSNFEIYKQALLAHNQSIVIEEVCKRPLFNQKGEIVAILGCAQDITHHAHPALLFSLYESYLSPEKAIQNFLRHKNLDTLFKETLSREELLTLIAMRDFKDTALIAKHLNYSFSEVERYQAQLQDKLTFIELDQVLSFLKWYAPDAAKDAIGGINA